MKYLKKHNFVVMPRTNTLFLKIIFNLTIFCLTFLVIFYSIPEKKSQSYIRLQRLDEFLRGVNSTRPVKPFFKKPSEMEGIECGRFFENDTEYENLYTENKITYKGDEFLSTDCREIRLRNYFPEEPLSEAEADFPIAFARIVYKVNLNFKSKL